MNVIQFTPRTTADPGLFEPLRSLAGLRPGDSLEQTGVHAARLVVELTPAPLGVDTRREGQVLLVVADPGERVLRRFDLADNVAITATRRTADGIEIEFVRGEDHVPARGRA
ncbi:MAG: hypothetical protein KIS68_08895 [Bauldia sp.]|nr:hypothetical protein [Bauldia sp.]